MSDQLVRLLTLDPLSRLLLLSLALDPPGPMPAPGDWNGLRGASLQPQRPAARYAGRAARPPAG